MPAKKKQDRELGIQNAGFFFHIDEIKKNVWGILTHLTIDKTHIFAMFTCINGKGTLCNGHGWPAVTCDLTWHFGSGEPLLQIKAK